MKISSVTVVLMVFVFGIMSLAFAQTNTDASDASGGGGGSGGGCYDTDGGKNLFVKGIAAGVWDSCLSSTKILERWCTVSNTGADYYADCPTGYACKDGACVASSAGGSGSEGGSSEDSCAKYYTCPDGSIVQYCFISEVHDKDGDAAGAGCGCKDPKSLCTSNVKAIKPVVVSPTTVTQISKPTQVNVQSVSTSASTVSKCPISDKLMKEYNQLLTELRKAESDDKEKVEEITKKIIALKQEITKSQEECKPKVTSSVQRTTIKPTVSAIAVTESKPIIDDSGEKIKDYYKTRIEKITSLDNVDEQIKSLKALREEIDNLIEDLLKSKDVITTNDIGDLVEKISVNPGIIKADNVQIKTVEKKVLMSVNDKPISIEPREEDVLIKDENLEVKTAAISIQNDVLRVGNAEVKLTANDVVNKLKIIPKAIELKEENAKAVYKIKTEENRKLIGFIPVKIEKDLTADANNGDVLEEKTPWYIFLTTGQKI